MASRAKFPVYRGEKPYIFVSYAHVDSETVLPIAEELHKRGYRVWYDEGIEAGSHWAEFIATHLEGAAVVLFFPSAQFNTNHNCEREVNFAVDAKKNMACVQLDEADMPPGLKMQLSTARDHPRVRQRGGDGGTADQIRRAAYGAHRRRRGGYDGNRAWPPSPAASMPR